MANVNVPDGYTLTGNNDGDGNPPPLVTSDPSEYLSRQRSYNDSLSLYNQYQAQRNQEKNRVQNNINNFNPIGTPSSIVTSFGNLLGSESHQFKPKYSEIENMDKISNVRNNINSNIQP